MQRKVLIIEDSQTSMNLLHRLVTKANLEPVCATSLTEAKFVFNQAMPEDFLCAIVDYHLPDAPGGQAIDFAINSFIPTIVITSRIDNETRDAVLAREVVDYIPKENAQVYDYLSRLLTRLEKNKSIGVLVVDEQRKSRGAMVSLLRRHHLQTFEAATLTEADSQLTAHNNIRLVLLDDVQKELSATQYLAQLRKSYDKDELAIIGLSGSNSSLLSARFIKSGANDFLLKPFCHEEFLCRITQNIELIENVEAIRRAANTDYLTGLPNRRHFFYTVNRLKRIPLAQQALALIDLDHFKRINDTYGHDAGDEVLKTVAKRLAVEFSDMHVARFGGEEFCVYLHDVAPQDAIERLRQFAEAMARKPVKFATKKLTITASIGLTTISQNNIEAMLTRADALLYNAKHNGRNRVVSDHPR